jgi:hypothetical protein
VKQWALKIAVVALLVGVAIALRGRDRVPVAPQEAASAALDTASDVVNRLYDAAGKGDDAAYLRQVSGKLRESLEYERSQLGVEAFRAGLRQSAAGIKGLAVTQRSDGPSGTIALDVEIVFADRNETQKVLLAPQGRTWVITSMETAEVAKPPIPYGTPVFAEPEQQGKERPAERESKD